MCDYIDDMIQMLTSINWEGVLNVVASLATLWTAGVAYCALNTWKRQTKAKMHADFFSELLNATHNFIESIHSPIEMVKIIKMGINSHRETPDESSDRTISHLAAYIQKNGEHDAKTLYDYLKPCQSFSAKIRSLSAKGQIFNFPNYHEIQNACDRIVRVSDRISALAAMIGNLHWNWQNPEIQKTLMDVTKIDPEELNAALNAGDIAVTSYIKSNFKNTYN